MFNKVCTNTATAPKERFVSKGSSLDEITNAQQKKDLDIMMIAGQNEAFRGDVSLYLSVLPRSEDLY